MASSQFWPQTTQVWLPNEQYQRGKQYFTLKLNLLPFKEQYHCYHKVINTFSIKITNYFSTVHWKFCQICHSSGNIQFYSGQ